MSEYTEQEVFDKLAKSGCQAFDYDAQNLQFNVSRFKVDLSHDALADADTILRSIPSQTPEALSDQYLVRNPLGGTYILPRLSQYLADTDLDQREQLRGEARNAMQQAYYILTDKVAPNFSFSVQISPEGEVDTAVMSSANLLRTAIGRFGKSTWDLGIYEIGTASEETPGYKQTLYAGLGYIAWRVANPDIPTA